MKKIVSIALALVMALSITSCDTKETDGQEEPSAPAMATVSPSPTPAPTPAPTSEPTAAPTPASVSGPTGVDKVDYTITRKDHGTSGDGMPCYFDLVELKGAEKEIADINSLIAQNYQDYQTNPKSSDDVRFVGMDGVEAEVTHNSDGIFSICYAISQYTNLYYHGCTYDLHTGKQLQILDLVDMGEGELVKSAKAAMRQYVVENMDYSLDVAESTLAKYGLKDLDFYVDDQGEIVYCVLPGELGPYAEGALLIPSGVKAKVKAGGSSAGGSRDTAALPVGEWYAFVEDGGDTLVYTLTVKADGAFSWEGGFYESYIFAILEGSCSVEGDSLNFHVTSTWDWDESGDYMVDTPADFTLTYRSSAQGEGMTFTQTSQKGYIESEKEGAVLQWKAGQPW